MIEFTVFYIIFSFCFVFPPSAFVSAGFTIANLLDSWLGSEDVQFLAYQLRRSVATFVIHSLLPFGYFIGLALIHSFQEVVVILQNPLLQIIWCLSVLLPSWASFRVGSWWQSNWETHPLVVSLKKYTNNGATWTSVASEINTEFRRIDKVIIRTNQISKVVITNSWIIKVEPYNVHVAHQNHVSLMLENAEEHNFTVGSQTVQFLSVRVEHIQTKELLFTIRINAIDYADMQDRLQSPINNFRGVTIHQDVHARFSKVFIEEVQQNPVFQTQEEMDSCLGCAINKANVRLVRRCESSSGCTPCFCRPMWCIFCLGKWFSARQDKDHPETWLSSRCPCPTCRSPFCMLDVSLVEQIDDN